MNLKEDIISTLPVVHIADRVNDLLPAVKSLVITAPPGAGKSTVLPLTICRKLGGKILMLEPRRLAARQVAERMAFLVGEKVGQSIGYRVRFESKVSQQTRIEVLTEGIFTRMIVEDPALEGVSAVIFDEFHERSLALDEALALARETQSVLRPDLKLVVMSATLDASEICAALDAPLVESEGRMFPVEIVRTQEEADPQNCSGLVARTVLKAHSANSGDILAFLPGEGEIRRCAELLEGELGDTEICPLYGMMPFDKQAEVLAPSAKGERKVVLATPVAETSLTIEGVRVVVDSGLCRRMVFNPRTSLGRLETVRISMDMAAQRSGRAGRLGPGVCYRLWSLATESRMQECRTPEILEADLAPVALDAAAWGVADCRSLMWLTPPADWQAVSAGKLLRALEAVDSQGHITFRGRSLAALPCHPRIANMLASAAGLEAKSLACDIAALIDEKDPLSEAGLGADMLPRLEDLHSHRGARVWTRVEKAASQYRRLVGTGVDDSFPDWEKAGSLLACAFPERVAGLRPEGFGKYTLATGENVSLDPDDPLGANDWIVAADALVRRGSEGRIFLAAALSPETVSALAKPSPRVFWDSRKKAVAAVREWRIGTLILRSDPLKDVDKELVASILADAVAKEAESLLDFSEELRCLQRRVAFVSARHPDLELPDVSDEALKNSASSWLEMFAPGASSASVLGRVDMCEVVWSRMSYEQCQQVERLAPTHVEVPTGSRIRLDYRQGAEAPVLKVRLQECFGLLDTPRVDSGAVPVLMELLSPGFKPVQLTSDLASFWKDTYFEVRKELRRRYPKHSWPDNPLEAAPVRGIRK